MSRLLPMPELTDLMGKDPGKFDTNTSTQYVLLRERGTKKEVPFDTNDPFPAMVQRIMEAYNKVLTSNTIMIPQYNPWDDSFGDYLQIRPVYKAIYYDRFHLYGRLHDGEHGVQNRRKIERAYIAFNGVRSIELDYSGMHPRMLYHMEGIDYQDDPYALWGDKTKPEQRFLAKYVINAALNAKSIHDAVSACNQKMQLTYKGHDGKKHRKTGKAAANGQLVKEVLKDTGLTFKQIFDLARDVHEPIKRNFCTDVGMTCMMHEAEIALLIVAYLTMQDIPCLCIHDSFVVPTVNVGKLLSVMHRAYEAKFGFSPEIKVASGRPSPQTPEG